MRADDRCQGNISKGSQVSPGVKATFSCAAAVIRIGRALWQRLRRSASESGRLRKATEGHPRGERRGEGLKLATLRGGVSADVRGDGCSIQQIGVQLP
jgi:hypothetical protein